jgi:hypothetical protein
MSYHNAAEGVDFHNNFHLSSRPQYPTDRTPDYLVFLWVLITPQLAVVILETAFASNSFPFSPLNLR